MKTSTINSSLWTLVTFVSVATVMPSCGDGDPTTNPDLGKGGTTGKGGTGGKGGSTGGSVTGGDAGTSGQGGTAGGGRGGTAGMGGTAGSAGTLGGEGGEAGAGGGEGGQGGMTTVTLYDFENGVQGWGTMTAGASVSQSTDQDVDGTRSLKVTHAALDGSMQATSSVIVSVSGAPVWPGTVLTFNAYLPAGLDTTGGTYFQAFTQANNYIINFETAGNSARTAVSGGWTTWTYTVPNTFPGGLQVLGFQLGDNSGGTTIPAGDVYLDAITATGGVANCAIATPAGRHDFETALPTNPPVYVLADTPQTSIAQATDRAFEGTGSLKVSFASLPGGTTASPTKRIIYIDKPNVHCGQTMTFHVFLPTGSDGLTFQLYAQYDNFGTFTGTGAQTVTRNAWNTATYTIPTVGPGGIQRVGMEFMYTGSAPLTTDAWVDTITW
jgi:hypothetical protein